MLLKNNIYEWYYKRILDFFIALMMLIVPLPLLISLCVVNAVVMNGNSFLVQAGVCQLDKILTLVDARCVA